MPTKVVVALLPGLAVTLFFLWVTVEGAAVPPEPHDVPVAVVGSSPEVAALTARFDSGGRWRVIPARTEAVARGLVQRRQAGAIVNLETRQLQTAQAALAPTPAMLRAAVAPLRRKLRFQISDLDPLPRRDPGGVGLLFVTVSFIFGGVPSGAVLAFLSRSRRPTSVADAVARVLLTVAFSCVLALLIAVLTNATLGYGGSHLLTVWGWGTLLCTASMATVTALVGALGLPGVLVGVVPIQFFGIPSAPVPVPWNFEPGIYRVLGPFDPTGATANGLLNGIFFGSASQAQNLEVLGVWIAAPVVLLVALGWWSQRAAARSVAPGPSSPSVSLESV